MTLDPKSSSNSQTLFLSFEVQNISVTRLAKIPLVLFSIFIFTTNPHYLKFQLIQKGGKTKAQLRPCHFPHHINQVINQILILFMIPFYSSLFRERLKTYSLMTQRMGEDGREAQEEETNVYIRLIHVVLQQKLTQHCKAVIFQ